MHTSCLKAFFANEKLLTLWSIASWDWNDTDEQSQNLAAVMKVSDDLDIKLEDLIARKQPPLQP